jgi:hypothetical protein
MDNITDQDLLMAYYNGWNECPNHNSMIALLNPYTDPLLQRAYRFGWLDYILGDDMPSVDAHTPEQIIQQIRNV